MSGALLPRCPSKLRVRTRRKLLPRLLLCLSGMSLLSTLLIQQYRNHSAPVVLRKGYRVLWPRQVTEPALQPDPDAFSMTWEGNVTPSYLDRLRVSLMSVFRYHPDRRVYLFSHDVAEADVADLAFVTLVRYGTDILEDSSIPLGKWWLDEAPCECDHVRRSTAKNNDFLRLAIVYKYGFNHIDVDSIVIRRLMPTPNPVLGASVWQHSKMSGTVMVPNHVVFRQAPVHWPYNHAFVDPGMIGLAALVNFPPRHPFIQYYLSRIKDFMHVKHWASIGPIAGAQIYSDWGNSLHWNLTVDDAIPVPRLPENHSLRNRLGHHLVLAGDLGDCMGAQSPACTQRTFRLILAASFITVHDYKVDRGEGLSAKAFTVDAPAQVLRRQVRVLFGQDAPVFAFHTQQPVLTRHPASASVWMYQDAAADAAEATAKKTAPSDVLNVVDHMLCSLYPQRDPHQRASGSDGVFLDIGAGNGRHSLLVASRGYLVSAMEPSMQHFDLILASIGANQGMYRWMLVQQVVVADVPATTTEPTCYQCSSPDGDDLVSMQRGDDLVDPAWMVTALRIASDSVEDLASVLKSLAGVFAPARRQRNAPCVIVLQMSSAFPADLVERLILSHEQYEFLVVRDDALAKIDVQPHQGQVFPAGVYLMLRLACQNIQVSGSC